MKKNVCIICMLMLCVLLFSGCVSGAILNDDTNEPLENVDVTLDLEGVGTFHTQTNGQGEYEFDFTSEDRTGWPQNINGTLTVEGGTWGGKEYQPYIHTASGPPDSLIGNPVRLVPVPTPASTPIIEELSQRVEYTVGDQAVPFTLLASVDDGGTLSYQWYQSASGSAADGTEIIGETSASYLPNIGTEGTSYYYCVVTNYNPAVPGVQYASATSNIVEIRVHAQVDAQAPEIIQNPKSAEYIAGSEAEMLMVSASVSDGGVLAYQWYQNTSESTEAGTEIVGATSESFMPMTDGVGTLYYYCVVTNHNATATGNEYASNISSAAIITVTPVQYAILNSFGIWMGTGDATTTIDAPYTLFTGEVYVDGNLLDSTNFTHKQGSTVITLKESYLKTLKNGTHDVDVKFENGAAATALTVNVASTNKTTTAAPQTGDESNIGLWICSALRTAAAI